MRNFLGNHAIHAILPGGVSMLLAALLVLLVRDVDDVKPQSA